MAVNFVDKRQFLLFISINSYQTSLSMGHYRAVKSLLIWQELSLNFFVKLGIFLKHCVK